MGKDAVDSERLAELAKLGGEDDPDFLADLVEHFLKDTAQGLNVVMTTFQNNQLEEMGKAAHRMKGSCSNLGAEQMARLCAQLNKADGSSDRDANKLIVEKLEEEFQRVKEQLATVKQG